MKFIRDPYSFKIAVRSYQLQNKTEARSTNSKICHLCHSAQEECDLEERKLVPSIGSFRPKLHYSQNKENLSKIGWEPIYQGKARELVVHMSVCLSVGSTPKETSML